MSIKYLIMALVLVPFVGNSQTLEYTLEECIEYAFEHNTDILNADLDKKIAHEKVQQTIATGLPQINGSADLGYNFKIQQVVVPARTFNPEASEGEEVAVEFGVPYTGNVGISANQMVFNGSYFVGLKAANTYRELSRKDWIKTRIDVVAAISKAYYTVLVNQERADLVEANYFRIDSLLQDTKEMNEAGFAEKIDVNRIQVQFNNIRVELENVKRMLTLSKELLKYQMGMPLTESLELKETITDIQFEPLTEQYGLDFQYDDRIEFRMLETNRDLLTLDIKNVVSQYLPQMYLYGNLGANTGRIELQKVFTDQWFSFGTVGVQLRMPIFDGLYKKNVIEEKKLEQEKIENSFAQLKNGIILEIEQALADYQHSIDNMEAQHENMKMAEEVYNVAKIKYEEGVGSNLEVTNADTDLKTAQTNYYNALYNALIARVDLRRAYGTLYNTNN